MVRMHTAFLITGFFNSSNSIILWTCTLYKHSFLFLTVFVSRWLRYWFLLYSQKCQNLKNIRIIYPPTVTSLVDSDVLLSNTESKTLDKNIDFRWSYWHNWVLYLLVFIIFIFENLHIQRSNLPYITCGSENHNCSLLNMIEHFSFLGVM